MRKTTLLALILALLAAVVPTGLAESADITGLGRPLEDFTVDTLNGGFTLSEALERYDAVLINLWASWCGPCEQEFPALEAAYEQYRDRVAVLALSIEPQDTPEVLAEYARSHGLTFEVGNDQNTRLAYLFSVTGVPTSLVVDKFGNVAFIETGMQTDVGRFAALFDYFLDENYTQTAPLTTYPSSRSNVEPASSEALSAAANAEGSALLFDNLEADRVWPMLPVRDGEREALASSNQRMDESTAAVRCVLNANDGDILAFEFRTSLETYFDVLFISVDGETVKRFSGVHDWTEWAIPLTAGSHEVAFGCEKDGYADFGEDRVWIANVRLASADEAEALLESLPAQPVAEAFSNTITNEDARRVAVEDPSGVIAATFGTTEGWVLNDDQLSLDVTLSASEDPETMLMESRYGGGVYDIREGLKADDSGYALNAPLTTETEGYDFFVLYPDTRASALSRLEPLLVFSDETGADAFVKMVRDYGYEADWRYADEDEAVETAPGEAVYTVYVADQNGDGVPGVWINFCTDTTCVPKQSNESGVIVFTATPEAYHLQIVSVPEGYEYDEDFELYTEARSGEYAVNIVKK